MADQSQGASPLSAVVADAATGIALALRGEGAPYTVAGVRRQDAVPDPGGDGLGPAAVRVLGADALAPYAVERLAAPPGADDTAVVRQALADFPPKPDASPVAVWSYRGLIEASHTYLPGNGRGGGSADRWPQAPDAGTDWVGDVPWPQLAHQVSLLASLALPGVATGLAERLAERTEDLARGFVRAVRRRDWLQAAGVGRWLARLPEVPETLGLDSGLAFVREMSGRGGDGQDVPGASEGGTGGTGGNGGAGGRGADPRVALHVAAARRFHGRGW